VKSTVYFLDFEDSYSYNIVADIYQYTSILPKIIPLHDHSNFLNNIKMDDSTRLILGPGPNAPKDYEVQFHFVKSLLKNSFKGKLLGICLGHQIILECLGYEVKRSQTPLHGVAIKLHLNPWWQKYFKTQLKYFEVQRYNSLAIYSDKKNKFPENMLIQNREIMLFAEKNILSMQFHPESVGTLHKNEIFSIIKDFLIVD
jgi:anthranilate/para-aminobenzoate synthase component II